MGDPTPAPGNEIGEIIRRVTALATKVADLERASGTQRYQSVEKLSALVEDIQEQLEIYNAARYTNAQIDSRIANPPSGVSAIGDVVASAALRGQNVYATQAPGFNITGNRVAGWIETATGRFGTASSSRRYKQDEAPADLDPLAILSIEPKRFRYIEQVDELGDGAAIEYGFIAEDLHQAGLYPWVVYREIDGEVVPDGVNYSMLAVALQSVVLWLAERCDTATTRIAALEDRLATQDEAIAILTQRIAALDGGTHGAD